MSATTRTRIDDRPRPAYERARGSRPGVNAAVSSTTTLPRRGDVGLRRPLPLPPRTGSKQVVSVRGRRVVAPKADPGIIRFTIVVITILALGVAATLTLAGITTRQSYRIATLQSMNQTLTNQIETLNRDVEHAGSAAALANVATEAGLVVPDAPGLITVDDRGFAATAAEPDPAKTLPVADVNGPGVRIHPATSDPKKTDAVAGSLQELPAAGAAPLPALAPYAPGNGGGQ